MSGDASRGEEHECVRSRLSCFDCAYVRCCRSVVETRRARQARSSSAAFTKSALERGSDESGQVVVDQPGGYSMIRRELKAAQDANGSTAPAAALRTGVDAAAEDARAPLVTRRRLEPTLGACMSGLPELLLARLREPLANARADAGVRAGSQRRLRIGGPLKQSPDGAAGCWYGQSGRVLERFRAGV